MAPMKRPAAAMGGAKKRKLDPVAQKCSAISAALLEHGALPASTSAMLSSMAGACLTVPKDDRHAYQAEIADMIGNALSAAETRLTGLVEEMQGKVNGSAADREARAAACAAAASALEGLKAATVEKKAALEEANTALKAAKAATAEAKKVQSAGDAVLEEAAAKQAHLSDAMAMLLAPLKERAATTKEDKVAVKKLAAIGKEFSFDASLLETLPMAVKKEPAERGSFDTLTLEKLEEQAAAAVVGLVKNIEDGQPGKAERAAAVAAAEAAQEAADVTDKAAADALAEAKAAEKAGGAALREAEKAVKSWLSDTKEVMDKFDSLTATLNDFRSGSLTFFGELKDLVPPPEPQEPEVPEVAAEAMAEPAAEAPAPVEAEVQP